VFAGGQPVAVTGAIITPHGNPKINPVCTSGAASIAAPIPGMGGSTTVMVNGLPVATVGSLCTCGHAILLGVPTVQVGI
jgi:uncharacterized Zn-binding protein involved in type VI secretion